MSEVIAKTPKTAEPQADYAIQVEAPKTATATRPMATTRKPEPVAEVVRMDENGDRFDKHGVRVGRWEMEPCGDDCMPNICLSFLLPCVSAAQISHRMGGSYVSMLLLWGGLYLVSLISAVMSLPSKSLTVEWESVAGKSTIDYVSKEEKDIGSYIVWTMVSCISGLIWLLVNVFLRSGVRSRFDLPGSGFCDCCCVLWCSWCSLTQLATHIKSYTPGTCSLLPSVDALDALPGYDDGEATQ